MTDASQQQDLLLRNFTETKRIDRRIYAIGDWVLPRAIPVRGIVMFLIVGIPMWIVYGKVGMEFGVDNMIWWIAPPAIAAGFGYAIRIQGKSLTDVIMAQLSFAWWWVQHHGDARTRSYRLVCVLWRPLHQAYDLRPDDTLVDDAVLSRATPPPAATTDNYCEPIAA